MNTTQGNKEQSSDMPTTVSMSAVSWEQKPGKRISSGSEVKLQTAVGHRIQPLGDAVYASQPFAQSVYNQIPKFDSICKHSLILISRKMAQHKCHFEMIRGQRVFSCGFEHAKISKFICNRVVDFMIHMHGQGQLWKVNEQLLMQQNVCNQGCYNWPCCDIMRPIQFPQPQFNVVNVFAPQPASLVVLNVDLSNAESKEEAKPTQSSYLSIANTASTASSSSMSSVAASQSSYLSMANTASTASSSSMSSVAAPRRPSYAEVVSRQANVAGKKLEPVKKVKETIPPKWENFASELDAICLKSLLFRFRGQERQNQCRKFNCRCPPGCYCPEFTCEKSHSHGKFCDKFLDWLEQDNIKNFSIREAADSCNGYMCKFFPCNLKPQVRFPVEVVGAVVESRIMVPVYHVGLTENDKNELKESNPKLLAASVHFPYLSLKQLTNRLKNAKHVWNMSNIEDVSIDGNRKSSDDADDWDVDSFEEVKETDFKKDYADFWAFFQEIKLANDIRVTGQASELAKFRPDIFEEYKESVWSSSSRDIELDSVTTFHSWMEAHSKHGRYYRHALENNISYNAAKALLNPRVVKKAREIFDQEEFNSLYTPIQVVSESSIAPAIAISESVVVEEVKQDSFYENVVSQAAVQVDEKESDEEIIAAEKKKAMLLALLNMGKSTEPVAPAPEQKRRKQIIRKSDEEYDFGRAPSFVVDDSDDVTNVHIHVEDSGKTNFFIGPMKLNDDFDGSILADRLKKKVSMTAKFVTGSRNFKYIHLTVPNSKKRCLSGYVETCEKVVRVMREIMSHFLDLGAIKATPHEDSDSEVIPIAIFGDCIDSKNDNWGFDFKSSEEDMSTSNTSQPEYENDRKRVKKICSRVSSTDFCEWLSLTYNGSAYLCKTS